MNACQTTTVLADLSLEHNCVLGNWVNIIPLLISITWMRGIVEYSEHCVLFAGV